MSFVARSSNPFRFMLLLAVVWGAGGFRPEGAHAQLSPAFTYQGQLQQSEIPENATCDFQFGLFAAASGGTVLGTQAVNSVTVTNGLFTVVLNDSNQLGVNAFSGSNRYLEVDVCCPTGCTPSYVTLSPRQQLTATPYALYAPSAGSATNLSGSLSGDVTGTQTATTVARINGSPLGSLGAATNNQALTFQSGSWGPGNVVNSLTTGSGISASSSTGSITLSVPSGGVTNSMLVSSGVTVTAGTGLSGGGTATLGGPAVTLTNSGVLSVSASAPLSVSSGQNPSVSLTGQVGLANGGTGASTPAGARSNLGAAASGANSDITSLLSNITFTGNVSLPESTATAGNILKGGVPFIHDFGTSNTFLGESAGNFTMTGGENTAMGRHALSANISGNGNTAVGYIALASNTSGWSNTGLGKEALVSNTTGGANTAVGEGSLDANATGSGNSAVGFLALEFNTTGTDNTAVGGEALRWNKPAYDVANCTGSGAPDPCCTGSGTGNCGGDDNTAVGASALADNTTGYLNTAVGYEALQNNATGADNTALGGLALICTSGDASYNTAVGEEALDTDAIGCHDTGTNNTAVGQLALSKNSGGSYNAALGQAALQNNTSGYSNTAVGQAALSGNIAGFKNTAVGSGALSNNTNGTNNVAVGDQALASATNSNDNIGIGVQALASASNCNADIAIGVQALAQPICGLGEQGQVNIAIGPFALTANTTGYENVAVGNVNLWSNTTGRQNTAVGSGTTGSLQKSVAGNNNTAIGVDSSGNGAGQNVVNGSNNIYLATSGSVDESKAIRIGDVQNQTFIAGINQGIGGSAACVVSGSSGNRLGLCSSSARFKEQVRDLGDVSSEIFKLRPVSFRYKKDVDPSDQERFGLVAEEVARINPDLVAYDDKGQPLTVHYDSINAMLLNEVQKQAHRIAQLTEQTQRATEQKRQISEQSRRLSEQAQQIAALQKQVEELVTLKAETAALKARLDALDTPQTVANRPPSRAQDARLAAF